VRNGPAPGGRRSRAAVRSDGTHRRGLSVDEDAGIVTGNTSDVAIEGRCGQTHMENTPDGHFW
jgi:hypothetical protein